MSAVKAAALRDEVLIWEATSAHDGEDGLWIETLSLSMTFSKEVCV